jgi:hypothetical protein
MLRLGTMRNTRGFIFAVASMARFRGFHGSKKRWKTRIGTGAVWLSVRRKDRTQASTDAARKANVVQHQEISQKIGGRGWHHHSCGAISRVFALARGRASKCLLVQL